MTTETLMTEAASTTEGTASAPATQPSATGAETGSQQQQATQEQGTQAAEAGQTQDQQQQQVEGAPESYDFKAGEGMTYDTAVIDAYAEVAKELNLSQDNAQKVLDKMAPVIAARQSEQLAALHTDWANSSKADKEFGGEKLSENLGTAKKAMDAFATPELRTLLNDSGLGNHPEVIRMFYRAGKVISEDGFVAGRGAPTKSAADVLYDKSTK
ncbi:MAG: protease [Acidovorax sp.]|jgi:hypothetical protein|nr:protease [Acidovorax sp.]